MLHTKTESKTNDVKITEALELLNEAAKEKKDELKELFTDKYSDIKQALGAGTGHGKEILDKVKHFTHDAIVTGGEKIKEFAGETDRRVHENPWPFIAGAAAISLLAGYIIGSRRK